MSNQAKLSIDKRVFFLIFAIAFLLFVLTNPGHRYTLDEDVGQKLAKSMVTQEPSTPSLYIPDKTRPGYDVPGNNGGLPICRGPVLCSEAFIGHGLVEAPFVFINHNFHTITYLSAQAIIPCQLLIEP